MKLYLFKPQFGDILCFFFFLGVKESDDEDEEEEENNTSPVKRPSNMTLTKVPQVICF